MMCVSTTQVVDVVVVYLRLPEGALKHTFFLDYQE